MKQETGVENQTSKGVKKSTTTPSGDVGSSGHSWQDTLREQARKEDGYDNSRRHLSPDNNQLSPKGSQKGTSDNKTAGTDPSKAVALQTKVNGQPLADDTDKVAWLAQGLRGPSLVKPSSGIGGFMASYDPASGVEQVTIGGAVTFKDGLVMEGEQVKANSDDPVVKEAADALNGMKMAERVDELVKWQWQTPAKVKWLKDLETVVSAAWSNQFVFHIGKTGWEDVEAVPVLAVSVHDGDKKEGDQVSISALKVPEDTSTGIGVVNSTPGVDAYSMELASSAVKPDTGSLLESYVSFTPGKNTVANEDEISAVGKFAVDFKSAKPGKGQAIACKVQGDGPNPEALAKTRYAALVTVLVAKGIEKDRLSYVYDGEGVWTTLMVGDGKAMTTGVHEFGHALGLTDEYAVNPGGSITGTGGLTGDASKMNDACGAVGLPGSVYENNDSVMSLGSAVKPQHAVSYLQSLMAITNVSDWKLGAGQKKGG